MPQTNKRKARRTRTREQLAVLKRKVSSLLIENAALERDLGSHTVGMSNAYHEGFADGKEFAESEEIQRLAASSLKHLVGRIYWRRASHAPDFSLKRAAAMMIVFLSVSLFSHMLACTSSNPTAPVSQDVIEAKWDTICIIPPPPPYTFVDRPSTGDDDMR